MPKRVLIVDDDPRFRALARKLLQRSGYAVVDEATDGAGAVASARRVCPDAALIDVQLPDTDGLTLARQLTETDNGLRIVLTSTRDGSAADVGTGLHTGARRHRDVLRDPRQHGARHLRR